MKKKTIKNSGARERGVLDVLNPHLFFLGGNSPLLNGLNPNLGNIAYSGKFSILGEKKYQIKRKNIYIYSFKDSSSLLNIFSLF